MKAKDALKEMEKQLGGCRDPGISLINPESESWTAGDPVGRQVNGAMFI